MLTGVNGRIDWHYYTAAGIHGYKVTPPPKGGKPEWTLVADVVLSDAFKMSQRPLTFIAKHAKGEWKFPVISFVLQGHKLRAQLGAPDRSGDRLQVVRQPNGKIVIAVK